MTRKTRSIADAIVELKANGKNAKAPWIRDPKYTGAHAEDYRVVKKFLWGCDNCGKEYIYRFEAENCELKHTGKIVETTVEIPEGEKVGDLKFGEIIPLVSCTVFSSLHDHGRDTISFAKVGAVNITPKSWVARYAPEDMHSIIWEERCIPTKRRVIQTRVIQVRYGRKQISTDILGGSIVWSDVE
jgi:hypothetical protein